MTRDAQMEIVGLLFLVIIGSLIFLFAMTWTTSPSDTAQDTYRQEILAQRFVNVLAATHVPQCDTDFETLVQDCARTASITCNGNTSCDVINHTARVIVNDTIRQWGRQFRLHIHDGTEYFVNVTNDCSAGMEREQPGIKQVPLYPDPGTAEIRLDICT